MKKYARNGQRRYLDPNHWIYEDGDGDVHFDAPLIAKQLDVSLDDACEMLATILEQMGLKCERLEHPDGKRRRGN